MKRSMIVSLAWMVAFGWTGSAYADKTEVQRDVSEVIVLPQSEAEPGVARALLTFDLPEVSEAELMFLDATVEWTAPFVEAEGSYEFAAYLVSESWNGEHLRGGTSEVAYEPKPVAYWSIEGQDFARHGALVRLRLTNVVRQWLSGSKGSHGILVKVWGLDEEIASEDAVNAVLKISHYESE